MEALTQLHGDCLYVLPTLPAGSVQCVVTSPPYYALRDYGLPPTLWPEVTYAPMPGLPPITIPGCDPTCDHEWGEPIRASWANENPGPNGRRKNGAASRSRGTTSGEQCARCGGWRGCLGLEPDPLMYVGHLVLIFRELRRVLANDGIAWLNLGDSYAQLGGTGQQGATSQRVGRTNVVAQRKAASQRPPPGTKPKDLLGIPWRAAFALQADGWYLRSDVVWNKPNCMPESVADRPTRAHEYLFLLAKSERYFYDNDAIREPYADTSLTRYAYAFKPHGAEHPHGAKHGAIRDGGEISPNPKGRNARTVWDIPTQPYPGAHYAVMPDDLADLCIKAGSRPGDTVLDPFGGTGTVARRAIALGRQAVLIELNPEYLALQDQRTNGVQTEFTC